VVHQRQGLPLGLEAGDHLAGIHARLDDLQRHLAPQWSRLFGHEHHTEAPFADLLQELVGADLRAGALRHGRLHRGSGECRGLGVEKEALRPPVLFD
jgi:hypothetical protein